MQNSDIESPSKKPLWVRIIERYPVGGELTHSTMILLGLIGLLIPVAIWFALTWGESVEHRIFTPYILPSPGETLSQFPSLVKEKHLFMGLYFSLRRLILGFLLAAVVGYPLGILMGTNPYIKGLFGWIVSLGRYLPIAALVPITLMFFKATETQKVVFLFIGTVFYLIPLVVESIERVPREIVQTAETLGVKGGKLVWKVIIPCAKPELFVHGIIMFGIGWTYIILAEIINAEYGLGHIISVSERRGPSEHVYGTLIVITVIGLLIDAALRRYRSWRYRWAKQKV